jgi:hypothetical protein
MFNPAGIPNAFSEAASLGVTKSQNYLTFHPAASHKPDQQWSGFLFLPVAAVNQ